MLIEFTIEINLSGVIWTDISDYVVTANWGIGFTGPYQVIARAEQLNLTLKNSDRRFSPEDTGGAYYPNFTKHKSIRINATYDGSTYTLFFGQIDGIAPQPNTKGERRTAVSVNGLLMRCQRILVNIELQENKTADQVIATILNDASFTANASGVWKLGVVGAAELGTNTVLGDAGELFQAETGISTFAVIADRWGEEVSAYGALRDTVGREYGKLFVNRNGTFVFWNRHHFLTYVDHDDTIAETDLRDMQYSYGDDLINEVVVPARPVTVGTSNEVLGRLDKTVKIRPGATKTITFHYTDLDTGQPVGGKTAVTPVKSTDYEVNDTEDGSGANMLSFMTATIDSETSTRCTVDFESSATVDVYLQSGAQIRGIKVTDYGEIEEKTSDTTSINAYGLMRWRYPYAMEDLDVAKSLSEMLLSQRKNPRGEVSSIAIAGHKSAANSAMVLALTIGSRVAISETQTGIDKEYFIIGENWRLFQKQYEVQYQLEAAHTVDYWMLGKAGYSELGATTVIAPL